MSETSISENALQARLREKLNGENIKLWTEPFFNTVTKMVVDGEVIALASRYATELKFNEATTIDCLFALQRNALERIAEREVFKNTGMSTLRLKFSGFSIDVASHGNVERIQINLSTSIGKELRKQVAEIISMEENRLKLICTGRVLKDDIILDMQGVKNGSQLMVLCVFGGQDQDEEQFRQLEETRGAADYLAGRQYRGDYSLNVENQDGKVLDLPPEEKKALAVALALHEKGRAAMKADDFSRALVFLLEADTVYNECQSGILSCVDNYGMLNLDIAWCYLTLQSISELPAVEVRLGTCEKALHRSYGEHMERVIALKGSSGWEAALFVRLHLLQAIAAYHLGHFEKSKFYLRKVESEIERLRVSDNQLADLINLGYGTAESTMALRVTYGNTEAAVNYILQKREEKEARRKEEMEERVCRRLERRLGMTDEGQSVNMPLLQNMIEMGYNAVLAISALKRANNDINAALQLVTDTMFISSVISDLQNSPGGTTPSQTLPSTNTTSQLEPEQGAAATDEGVVGAQDGLPPISPSLEMLLTQALGINVNDGDRDDGRSAEEIEHAKQAYESLSKDISSESEYIDLTLSAENQYFQQYKNLLNM